MRQELRLNRGESCCCGRSGAVTTDIQDKVAEVVLIASAPWLKRVSWITEQLEAAKAAITQRLAGETLEQLQISQMQRQCARSNVVRLYPHVWGRRQAPSEGDFSPGDM